MDLPHTVGGSGGRRQASGPGREGKDSRTATVSRDQRTNTPMGVGACLCRCGWRVPFCGRGVVGGQSWGGVAVRGRDLRHRSGTRDTEDRVGGRKVPLKRRTPEVSRCTLFSAVERVDTGSESLRGRSWSGRRSRGDRGTGTTRTCEGRKTQPGFQTCLG